MMRGVRVAGHRGLVGVGVDGDGAHWTRPVSVNRRGVPTPIGTLSY
jgi:hypothetical protein